LKFIGDPLDTPPINPPPTQPPPVTPPPGQPTQGCDITAIIAALANFIAALFGSEKRLTTQTLSAQSATGTFRAADASATTAPENHVDCALARPIDPTMFSDNLKNIGIVNDTKEPMLGMRVRKFGRTTEYTEGNITLLNATVNIAYNTMQGQRTARFVGQVITESMSQGGDSGSLIIDVAENKAVGLLFAGSNLATIFSPINLVLDALNITL
jgi:hypothetical protein